MGGTDLRWLYDAGRHGIVFVASHLTGISLHIFLHSGEFMAMFGTVLRLAN